MASLARRGDCRAVGVRAFPLKFVATLAFFLTGLGATVAQVALPVINGGFESGATLTVPSGWTVAGGENPFWIGASSLAGADPGSGYLSSQFISSNWAYGGLSNANSLIGGGAYSTLVYQDIDLSPYSAGISEGQYYLGVSYAFFHNDANDIGTIEYNFFDSSNSIVGGYTAQTRTGGGWQLVENLAAVEVPSDATRLRIGLGADRASVGTQRNIAFDAVAASLQLSPGPDVIRDKVNANLIQFDSDGNWTWYSDERAIVNPNNGRVLVNSVGFDETVQGGGYPGNIDVVDFDPTTGRRLRTRLSNQVAGNPAIQNDDHNVGALLVLPDGRYLAMYANHGNNGGLGDEFSRWRVSNSPGDSTGWTQEQVFNWLPNVPGANQTGNSEAANVSYHNLFYLSAEDQVYNISRSYGQLSVNGASQNMPNVMRYDVENNSVEWAGQLLESSAQGYSAYPKYVSNGVDRIYFTTTETHPRNYNNSIFAGYIQNGQTFDMLGNVIDPNVFDNGTAAGGSGFVSDVTDYTLVDQPDPLGQGQNRLWTTDAGLDSSGNLMALYTSRWNSDGSTNDGGTNNPIDHRLHFARWNPGTSAWETQEIARMGDRLYGPEQDYTGLGTLVPGNENKLYISTPYDPRDASGETQTQNHEIYRGDFDGVNWNWTALTENSSVDNLRPIAPDTHGVGPQPVFWFRGNYNTAHDINAAVVGILDRTDESGLVTYVDAGSSNTTRLNGSPVGATAAASTPGADDNLWHVRTGFGNGGSVYASNESGAENAPALRTTAEDLAGGLYDVFAYFWSDNDEDWRLQAGLEASNLIDFRKYGSQHAAEEQFVEIDSVTANSNDLLLYRAYLGRASVADGADLVVYIDDWQTLNGDASRTWYDGIGYALVTHELPGDFNNDGVVDAADYTVWRDNVGRNNSSLNGAGDESGASFGVVDGADYDVWAANYGSTLAAAARVTIPEPTSLVGAVLLTGALLRSTRNRR